MKQLVLVILLASCCAAAAADRYTVTLDAKPPTPADALLGSAALTLEGLHLTYELHLTGRWLGHLTPEMDPLHPPQPSITLEGVNSSTPAPWSFGVFDGPFESSEARYTFTGSATLSDAAVAELVSGESAFMVDYGFWGTVSGAIVPIPEPSSLTLINVGVVLVLVVQRSRLIRVGGITSLLSGVGAAEPAS